MKKFLQSGIFWVLWAISLGMFIIYVPEDHQLEWFEAFMMASWYFLGVAHGTDWS